MDIRNGTKFPSAEDPKLKQILSTIKSCIASSKESLTIEQLNRDYMQLDGSPIPFKEYQHGTLASFLQAFPKPVRKPYRSTSNGAIPRWPQKYPLANIQRQQSLPKPSLQLPQNCIRPANMQPHAPKTTIVPQIPYHSTFRQNFPIPELGGRISKTFSSYPNEYRKQEDAENDVTKKALEYLQNNGLPKSPPSTSYNFNEVAKRVKQLLERENCNVWWSHIQKLYAKEFKEMVPVQWIEEACKVKVAGIDIDQPAPGDWILMLNNVSHPAPSVNKVERMQPKPLQLPEDNMWEVIVSYFKNCSEVWLRLLGKEYNNEYENLVTDMELHYMEEKNRTSLKKYELNSYYAFYHDESWFRVRLVSLEGTTATVFLIDHGDNETVVVDKLFYLEPKFYELPCQSICSCLAGFEGGINDPALFSTVQNLALGKPLVAEVVSRKQPFSVVLYDTTTNEDININERIFKVLTQSLPVASFPQEGGISEIYVSHVTADGDVFINIKSSSYKVLESLVVNAKQRAEEILGNDSFTIDLEQLYFAKFSDGDWKRAELARPNKGPANKVLLRSIDFGKQELVPQTHIIPLEKVSVMLGKIPPQSLCCRLYNVPSSSKLQWSPKATEALTSLLSKKDEPLLLKVIKESTGDKPTLVELFKRVQPQNMLASINATLDVDVSLFSSEDKNNNLSSEKSEDASKQPRKEHGNAPVDKLVLQEICTPDLPATNSYFDVFVTYAASPFNFAVQPWRNAMKLSWLMGEMKSFYTNTSNLVTVSIKDIKLGNYYALLHSDNDWYRVRVDQIHDQGNSVSGIFIDYGDCFCQSIEKIQPLWANFKYFPYQAFKAKLAGITPNNKDWMPEESLFFRQLVENKPFVSVVTQIYHHSDLEPPTLVLQLIDTKDPKVDVYIAQVLIDKGMAQKE